MPHICKGGKTSWQCSTPLVTICLKCYYRGYNLYTKEVDTVAVCYVCGKKKTTGNNVSHANNKTRRWFHPNLQTIRAHTDKGPRKVSICTRCLRSGLIKKAI
ncbi:MAG: 50S ribosomal protein L28 [Nitrospirae bacterium]|nr:50S ribosomal protein L28 [Nitrospirota bacterium]